MPSGLPKLWQEQINRWLKNYDFMRSLAYQSVDVNKILIFILKILLWEIKYYAIHDPGI